MAWQRTTSSHARGYGAKWQKVRLYVLERDRGRCYVCGGDGANQVDHVVSRAKGGSDHPSNLRAIHDKPCHRTKSAREGAASGGGRGWSGSGWRGVRQNPIAADHPGLLR